MYLAIWIAGTLVWVALSVARLGRTGVSQSRALVVMLATIVAGFFGARLHAVVWELGVPFAQLWSQRYMVLRFTGMRLPGGLLLGGLTAAVMLRLLKLPVLASLD